MPAKDRKVVRILTALAAHDRAPDVFSRHEPARETRPDAAVQPASDPTLISTTAALIESARQTGTLDQLADQVRANADLKAAQKVENAEGFYILVELARGQGARVAPRIENRLAELKKENETAPEPATNGAAQDRA